MGTHIYGWIEIKKFDSGFDDWFPVIDIGIALHGNYDIYGCLFGVRNYANFAPLFPFRGVPLDCSEEIIREYAEGYEGITWCTYQELTEINLDELSDAPDQRFHTEMETPNGTALVKRFAENEEEKPVITRTKAFGKDKIYCMICGKGFKTLSRHLKTSHEMTASEYRKQFDIPRSQSLAAKNYSESRRQMAVERGLADNLAKARAARGKKKK